MRSVLGIAAGYMAMAVTIFMSFTLLYLAVGPEKIFEPRSFQVTQFWIYGTLLLTVSASMLGGWLTIAVSKSANAVMVLAAIAVVVGVALVIVASPDPTLVTVRVGDVSVVDAMTLARQPAWVDFLTPCVAALGALAGGRF